MKKNKKATNISIIARTILAMFLGYMLMTLLAFTIDEIKDGTENTTENLNRCERYYTDRDFDGLADVLQLYDTFDERFDIYWEVTEAYQEYMSYLQWHDLELTTDGAYVSADEASANAEKALQSLEEMAANPVSERNRQPINNFLEQAKNYKPDN
jgi:hypothetical protein